MTFTTVKDRSRPCSELYNGMIVFANGDVRICWRRDVEAKLIIGNIHKSHLKDIWRGRPLSLIRENWSKGILPPPCRNCYCYTPISKSLLENESRILNMERKQVLTGFHVTKMIRPMLGRETTNHRQ